MDKLGPWGGIALFHFRGVVIRVERDDPLCKRSCSHFFDQPLVMPLACLDVGDPVGQSHRSQLTWIARLDFANEPILSPEDQVEVLSRQVGAEPVPQKLVHLLEIQEQLRAELGRHMTEMRLEVLVLVASEEPGDPLGEAEVITVQATKIANSWKLRTSNGEFTTLTSSLGGEVPSWVSLRPERWISRWLWATRSRGRSFGDRSLLLRNLGSRLSC